MIEIIKQDRHKNEILDTEIKVIFTITVIGSELEEFKEKLKKLVDEYRI
jgi:hypothetical protein